MAKSGCIVVLLDSSPASEAALATAARFAHYRDLELVGLFIEERDLLDLAAHPFAREISALSGISRPFDSEALRSRLELQRRRIEQRLKDAAGALSLRWSLHVQAGSVLEALARPGIRTELLFLGKTGWSGNRGSRLGSSAAQALFTSGWNIVLSGAIPKTVAGVVQALITEASSGPAVVRLAVAMAEATDRPLRLLFAPTIDQTVERSILDPLLAHTGKATTGLAPALTIEHLRDATSDTLRQLLARSPGSELVMARSAPSRLGCDLLELLSLTDAGVAVVSDT
ncbi:MAG: hypothetical protein ABR561_04645 [Guyparkeria sp.]